MRPQAKPPQQPGTGDTPDSVCAQQFAASANPQAHEQGRRSRSSFMCLVIFGSPVLRWHRLRRLRPTPLPVGGRRLRSGSYRSADRAARAGKVGGRRGRPPVAAAEHPSLSWARGKLGADPLRMLFGQVAGLVGADGAPGVFCCG